MIGCLILGSIATYQQILITKSPEIAKTVTATISQTQTTTITLSTTTSVNNTVIVSAANQTIASTLGPNGIMLLTSINATTLIVGQQLEISVSLFNSLPRVNSVPTAADWQFRGVPLSLWQDCDVTPAKPNGQMETYATEVVVLPGYYTISNISTVASVLLPTQACHGLSSMIDHVIFQPTSSTANITGIGGVSASGPINMTAGPFHTSNSFTTRGSWDLSSALSQLLNGSQPAIITNNKPEQAANIPPTTSFSPGIYTIGISDEWGQNIIFHFDVLSE